MYLTFKNLHKHNYKEFRIIDPYEYLFSNGTKGFQELEIQNYTANLDFITVKTDKISPAYIANHTRNILPSFIEINRQIKYFYTMHPDFKDNKQGYYTKFCIPKKKKDEHGNIKWRHLINPHPELKILQKNIAITLQQIAHILPHNAAHAFTEGRDYYTNAKIHQKSKHIINLDLKDFFNSITTDIVKQALLNHPAFNVPNLPFDLIDNIIDIATFEGCTPQGSPLSPYLSNIVMVAFDYEMRQRLNNNEIKTFYTRYADDMTFSSKKSQDITNIIHMVENLLQELYNGSIKINYSKTKKITPGRCFITGVKLNKEHNLTVGWEKKKVTKSRIYNLYKKLTDPNTNFDNDEYILLEEAQSIMGYLAFMFNIEPDYVRYLHTKYKKEIMEIDMFIVAQKNF